MSLIISSYQTSSQDTTKPGLQDQPLKGKECRCYAWAGGEHYNTLPMECLQHLLACAQASRREIEAELAYLKKTHLDLRIQIIGLEGHLETILEEKETESDRDVVVDLARLLDESC